MRDKLPAIGVVAGSLGAEVAGGPYHVLAQRA